MTRYFKAPQKARKQEIGFPLVLCLEGGSVSEEKFGIAKILSFTAEQKRNELLANISRELFLSSECSSVSAQQS